MALYIFGMLSIALLLKYKASRHHKADYSRNRARQANEMMPRKQDADKNDSIWRPLLPISRVHCEYTAD